MLKRTCRERSPHVERFRIPRMTTRTGFEFTLVILKPHVTCVPHVVKDIRRRIIKNGFYVLRSKQLSISVEDAREFYREHREKFFFNRLITFITSGPCHLHVLGKEDAISSWRTLMGPTKVFRTIYSHPESIRGTHGLTDTRNATHGSDSVASAKREIKFFFPEFDTFRWHERESGKFFGGQFTLDRSKFVHVAT